MKRISVTVDINKVKSIIVNGLVQFDDDAAIDIKLLNGSSSFDFSEYTAVTIEIIRPDGKAFVDCIGDHLTVEDAAQGFLTYKPVPEVTKLVGLYFVDISIYTNGKKMTTSRFTYNVSDGNIDNTEIEKEEYYPVLLALVKEVSTYKAAEEARERAEKLRASETAGIIAQANKILENIQEKQGYLDDLYSAFVQIANEITGSNFDVTSLITSSSLETRLKGIYPIKGSKEGLEEGQLGFDKSKGLLYIGGAEVKVLNKPEVAISGTEPEDKSLLWLDNVSGKVKYYAGGAWSEAKCFAVYK